ncbi:MAG: peptidoglycan-binding protein [Gemmatimonadetes bacterium]|nr:peptidoglycan-binding protein [Gemmatimonadota bacterium]
MSNLPSSVLGASALLALTALPALAQDKDQLEKCERPIGTMALAEPRQEYMQYFARYSLGSPTALLRMMVQQSKCFVVLERGAGMEVMKGERELAGDGEGQAGSNMGKGQMVLADFVMNPAIQVVDNNAGGAGGAIGGIGRRLGVGAIAGGVKFKEATTTILIADARTTVQVAAAEGKAKKTDFSLGMFGWAGGMVGGGGAYTSTAEGKMIAASYMDNFNNIVKQLKDDPVMTARAAKFDPSKLASGDVPKAGTVFNEGDVLAPKIDNVKIHASPSDAARVAGTVKKSDDLIFAGEEKDGFLKVMGSNVEGWVKKDLRREEVARAIANTPAGADRVSPGGRVS